MFRSDLTEDFMPARVREGIDVALFTDLQVLTPAAWLDFTAHIESLLAAGRREAALVLWESVVEIFHVGSPSGEVLQSPTMPPIRRIPCSRCSPKKFNTLHRRGFGMEDFPKRFKISIRDLKCKKCKQMF